MKNILLLLALISSVYGKSVIVQENPVVGIKYVENKETKPLLVPRILSGGGINVRRFDPPPSGTIETNTKTNPSVLTSLLGRGGGGIQVQSINEDKNVTGGKIDSGKAFGGSQTSRRNNQGLLLNLGEKANEKTYFYKSNSELHPLHLRENIENQLRLIETSQVLTPPINTRNNIQVPTNIVVGGGEITAPVLYNPNPKINNIYYPNGGRISPNPNKNNVYYPNDGRIYSVAAAEPSYGMDYNNFVDAHYNYNNQYYPPSVSSQINIESNPYVPSWLVDGREGYPQQILN